MLISRVYANIFTEQSFNYVFLERIQQLNLNTKFSFENMTNNLCTKITIIFSANYTIHGFAKARTLIAEMVERQIPSHYMLSLIHI